jgi:hypothetical protein
MASRINADSSNGLQLVSDSSGEIQIQSSGVTKATVNSSGLSSPGHVLQVVNATQGTEVGTTSSTYIDTGLSASITPSSSSSKILVLVSQNGVGKDASGGGGNTRLGMRLFRDSTQILQMEGISSQNGLTSSSFIGSVSTCYLDSPATTSSTIYKTQFANLDNNGTVRVNTSSGAGKESYSTITLMEIAG